MLVASVAPAKAVALQFVLGSASHPTIEEDNHRTLGQGLGKGPCTHYRKRYGGRWLLVSVHTSTQRMPAFTWPGGGPPLSLGLCMRFTQMSLPQLLPNPHRPMTRLLSTANCNSVSWRKGGKRSVWRRMPGSWPWQTSAGAEWKRWRVSSAQRFLGAGCETGRSCFEAEKVTQVGPDGCRCKV